VTFYADAEGGAYLEDPTRGDLIDLVTALNTSNNTFIVVHPDIDDADWFFSISKKVGTFGGYELHRYDPDTAEDTKTTAAAPNVIADDILDWVNHR
jgi:hypothetical protein